ncbi:MAG: HAD family hydrolase [Dehalococcoidia bacterium]
MNFGAVVFDLDGTLLDTLEDIADSANRVLAGNGLPTHGLDDYRRFVGSGIDVLMARAMPTAERNGVLVTKYVEEFRKDYGRNWNNKTKPYPGVADTLDALAARHLKLAILSNKPHNFTLQCVAELLPRWKFDCVLGHQEGVPPKPDPAGAEQIVKQLKLDVSRILYVGDSDIDMQTAVAAGMFPVGALWGFRTLEELQKSGARSLIGRPQEVLDLL